MPATKRKRLLASLLLLSIVGGLVGIAGSIRHAAGDAEGQIHASSPTTAPTRLRLASFNIHSGVGQDNRFDLNQTASLLKGFDLIWLNEVRGGHTEELSQLLGRQGIFEPSERRFWHDSFGSALLYNPAVLGVSKWHRTQLASGSNMAFRSVVRLETQFGAGTLNMLLAHLGRDSDHQPQFQAVADMFLKLPEPKVLMGDLNTTEKDPVLQKILDQPGIEDPVGQRSKRSVSQRLDFILIKGLKWSDAGLVENTASDHPMVWVQIGQK